MFLKHLPENTSKYLSLIRNLDLKLEDLLLRLRSDRDLEFQQQGQIQALNLQREKIQISEQMTEEIEFAKNQVRIEIEELVAKNPMIQEQYNRDFLVEQKKEPSKSPSEADQTLEAHCICKQILQGEMIGCENNDCPIGWFHLQCVGMTQVPSGEWYCDHCKKFKQFIGNQSSSDFGSFLGVSCNFWTLLKNSY